MQTDFTRPSMAATDAEAHDSFFSRTAGMLEMAGNADSVLKTLVSDTDADNWRLLSRSLGMNSSQLLRHVVRVRMYGEDGVLRMAQEEIFRANGKVPVSVLSPEKEAM